MSGEPLIHLEGVARTYAEGVAHVRALLPTDLVVAAGEHVAVMGPSGSGKSTLLHILGCIDRPTAGRYRFEGHDTTAWDDAALSLHRGRTIGFVFQRFHLLRDATALENVELPLLYQGLGRRERRQRAREALDRVGLTARWQHEPGRLSGGEQQRVALARALVKEPRLLLCDEPTGNLDSETGRGVLELLEARAREGTTLITITHDPEVAARAPRRLYLRDGVLAG